jgi:hypothetical protein
MLLIKVWIFSRMKKYDRLENRPGLIFFGVLEITFSVFFPAVDQGGGVICKTKSCRHLFTCKKKSMKQKKVNNG